MASLTRLCPRILALIFMQNSCPVSAKTGIGREEPDTVVPILIECLAPTNKEINRPDTLRALAGIAAKAKAAVPAIHPYLNDADPTVRAAATNALQQIEPSVLTTN